LRSKLGFQVAVDKGRDKFPKGAAANFNDQHFPSFPEQNLVRPEADQLTSAMGQARTLTA